ncbi:unnamed protein product [Rotaria sordida]|uniref:Uncharacterized protein n=1 Tax=Rotaria sordida TaxID=392033 RepID=A0A815GUD6_9BILA|nr:unnamed protein product [Rotaria sordida]
MYQNVQFDNLPKRSIQQFIKMFNSTIYRNVGIKLKYKLFFLFMYDSTADRNVQFNNLLKCSIQQFIEMCDSTTDRNVNINLKYQLLFVFCLGSIQQFIKMFNSTIYRNVRFNNLLKCLIQQFIKIPTQQLIEMFD